MTVKADTIKLENTGNIVLKISDIDGFEVKDDNLLMKPGNIFQIRNKLDDDYVMQVKTLNSGQEETSIHGKNLAIELRGADSISTVQAGTMLIRKVEASNTATDVIKISSSGLRVTDDRVVNIASEYLSIRNAADDGDVIKVNNVGTKTLGSIATNAALYMSGNEVKIVPTDSLIIGNSDDTSNRIVLNNTQHGGKLCLLTLVTRLEYVHLSLNFIQARQF